MKRFLPSCGSLAAAFVLTAAGAAAQDFEVAGTRALGMAGAFVAVADDASAVYWNPGGLAAGSYFSLVADYGTRKSLPDNDLRAASHSGTILALTTPVLGLGYYRLSEASVTPVPTGQLQQDRSLTADGAARLDTLITHHLGVTVVQSLASFIAVGTTVKAVRGVAASGITTAGDREALLDRAGDVIGRASTKFDTDVGVLAVLGALRAGLTLRNLTEPKFEVAVGGPAVRLQREARAGLSVRPGGVLVAADFDLTRHAGPLGDVRNIAAGAEARVVRRVFVRGGLRMNTIEDDVHGRTRAAAIGGSVAVAGSVFIDVQASTGSGAGSHGWGVAGRVGF